MWDAFFTDDATLFPLADGQGEMEFTKRRQGLNEFREYLRGLVEMFEMQHYTVDQTIAESDRVVGIGSTGWTHRSTGQSFETPVVVVTRWRDGRMNDFSEFYDTARVVAACSAP